MLPLRGRTRAEIIAGDGGRALVPRACGAVGCARGARPCIPAVSAVCLPASGRARSACRAVCAVRALRRASPPSSGGQVRALKGFSILQREHRGTGTRLRRSDRRRGRRLSPKARKKAPALTKSGGDREIPPNGQQNGRKWAVKGRRAVGRRGMGHFGRAKRRSACSAASNPRKRRRSRPRTPSGTCKICHPVGTGRPRSSGRFRKSSESGARQLPFCASPLAILSRARPLPCCPHRPHPVYTGRGWGSKHFLPFFALKNRSPRSSTRRRRSSAQQRAPSPALGAR